MSPSEPLKTRCNGMTERMSSRPDEMPELLIFHLNPDECFLTDEMHDKMDRLCYADASEKLRVKFRVWQLELSSLF